MGTEILYLFLPVPVLLWCWDIWQLRKIETRKQSLVLLGLGFAFMAYMCLPISTHQYFVQNILFGSFLYGPFYFFCKLLLFKSFRVWLKNLRRQSKIETAQRYSFLKDTHHGRNTNPH
jgi:hypothetical protein